MTVFIFVLTLMNRYATKYSFITDKCNHLQNTITYPSGPHAGLIDSNYVKKLLADY